MIEVIPERSGILPPPLVRVLAAFPDESGHSAATALQTLLESRVARDGELAWYGSRLTGNGFPVEVTFATSDDRLRYTVEPASSTSTPQARLEAAIDLLQTLGGSALPEGVVRVFRLLLKDQTFGYGAWLGGRHGKGGSEFKIYVEAGGPEAGFRETQEALPGLCRPRLPDRIPSLRMVAFESSAGRWEAYFRISSLRPHHLPRVLGPAGLEGRSDELIRFLSDLYGYPLDRRLPGSSVGVSYTWRASEAPRAVTLFCYTRALWGGDARIRRKFGRFSRERGWDDKRYQEITSPLASRRSWKTYHGLLGITLRQTEPFSLSIGVRPPEASK